MRHVIPYFLGSLAVISTGCGSQSKEPTSSFSTSNAETVAGPGFTFQFTPNSRIERAELDYEGERQILVNIATDNREPDSEIWITKIPCQLNRESVETFRSSLKDFTLAYLNDGLSNGGFEITSPAESAVQKIAKTSNARYLAGYYFDYVRTYHKDRAERLLFISDFVNNERSCLKVKASSAHATKISPSNLLGKTLVDIQSSLSFITKK